MDGIIALIILAVLLFVNYILVTASKKNASDIHFDPADNHMKVRFRIDGDCQDYTFVPKAYEKNLKEIYEISRDKKKDVLNKLRKV